MFELLEMFALSLRVDLWCMCVGVGSIMPPMKLQLRIRKLHKCYNDCCLVWKMWFTQFYSKSSDIEPEPRVESQKRAHTHTQHTEQCELSMCQLFTRKSN